MQVVTTPPRLRRRPSNIHKGRAGRVLIVGGSRNMVGAPMLAARGALRAGAGLVQVAVPHSIHAIAASFLMEALTLPLRETTTGGLAPSALESLREPMVWADAIVVGPGCAQDNQTFELLRELVSATETPIVLDADGLNAWAGHLDEVEQHTAPLVLTPHEGEAARLLSCSAREVASDRSSAALDLSRRSRAVAVLKGPGTLVTDGRRMYRNGSGGPVLASGGSGDVLAGIVAALLAGNDPTDHYDAACAGVYWHGLAGDEAASACTHTASAPFPSAKAREQGTGSRTDRGVLASEIADALPRVLPLLLEEAGTFDDE